jgi:hypothetical protein
MRSIYVTYALAALSFGLSIAFWRAANENGRLVGLAHAAEMAQLIAEEEAQSFREKLRQETKGRQLAEASQTVAETAERGVREKLARETKLRESAEAGRGAAGNEVSEATQKIEGLNERLAKEEKARQVAEAGREETQDALRSQIAALDEETSARKSAVGALFTAEEQVRILSAKLVEEMTARQEAELRQTAARRPAKLRARDAKPQRPQMSRTMLGVPRRQQRTKAKVRSTRRSASLAPVKAVATAEATRVNRGSQPVQ